MGLHTVIMAGGKGERLWPVSRDGMPKQLFVLEGGRSLIRNTVDRLLPLTAPERMYVVTGNDIVTLIARELPDLPRENILAEPFGRNTAACIALAAAWISRNDPDGLMAVFPSDHLIRDTAAFQDTVAFGAQCLKDFPEYLITIGIRPKYPETGYGYIAPGEALSTGNVLNLYRVESFHEKPDRSRAEEYINRGYLWNAGMFLWRVDAIMHAFERYMPKMYHDLVLLFSSKWRNEDILRFYQDVEAISIDYAIMEKASKVAVIPSAFSWNDVGSWDAVGKLLVPDQNGNAVRGPSYLHESSHNVVWGCGKQIVLIGIDNMVVVEGEDAVLVCPRKRSQDVSKVLKRLKGSTPD